MIVALVLGLVLVAIPLYLWRRPRNESLPVATSTEAGVEPSALPSLPPADDKLVIADAKVVACHDPGPKKTSADQCDHVVELEKALAKAIEDSASCMPKEAGGGSITFLADVSFKKRERFVIVPKDGSTVKSAKAVKACEAQVKAKLKDASLDNAKHDHQRYKVQIVAVYPSPKL